MIEGGDTGGTEPGHGSKPMSTCEAFGDRIRFTVELRPGETTIVSWKKLLKESTSTKPNGHGPSAPPPKQSVSPPPPPALAAPVQTDENKAKDSQAQPGTSRLSNVIEKIERMYAGDGSSDDEDVFLDDVPDDDEYDTEDSFIDDAELDDYFQVDNSSIKHDGFFINRGKLERKEPVICTEQQPKKRRRKGVANSENGNDDVQNPNKHAKIGNKGRKVSSSVGKNSTIQTNRVVAPNVHEVNVPEASHKNAGEALLKKKTTDTQAKMDPSGLSRDKDADRNITEVISSQNHNSKLKDNSELHDTSTQKANSSILSKSHSAKQADQLDQPLQQKEESALAERYDFNISACRDPIQTTKVPLVPRKEGSSVRPKMTTLEKAIKELEKIVAESRPPSTEVQDPDNSAQGVKRRLSPEIKQKLSKVARIVQSSYGKMPKEVLNRLMSILGHMMQLRTLKRNLRIMANLGLSAKKEKDDRLQKTKQEVAEMVQQQLQYMKSKVQQQTADADDFQEVSPEEKEALKRKYSIDDALENKICDLYDLYVERQEEDSGPPVRRLYEELTALWPTGVMNIDAIKRAIRKAKDRRRALSVRKKDQEKIKKKRVLATKVDDSIRGEASTVNRVSHSDHASPLTSKPVLSASVSQAATLNVPAVDKLNQGRANASTSNNSSETVLVDLFTKKKVKKKPSSDTAEAQLRLDKAVVPQAEEKHKHQKHVSSPPSKSNVQQTLPTVGSEK